MPRGRTSPIGTVTVNANGYSQTKVGEGKWLGTHVVILEEKLGRKLRPGERAIFVDSDKTNLSPDNIQLAETMSTRSIEARIARLEAEIADREGLIKDLRSQLSAQE